MPVSGIRGLGLGGRNGESPGRGKTPTEQPPRIRLQVMNCIAHDLVMRWLLSLGKNNTVKLWRCSVRLFGPRQI